MTSRPLRSGAGSLRYSKPEMSHFGIALCSLSCPSPVTSVPESESRRSRSNPSRLVSPPSVTRVSSSLSVVSPRNSRRQSSLCVGDGGVREVEFPKASEARDA